jgi:hypothetical protein
MSELKFSFKDIDSELYSKIIIDKTKCLRYTELVKNQNIHVKKIFIQISN